MERLTDEQKRANKLRVDESWNAANPEKRREIRRAAQRLLRYGMTKQQHADMLEKQGGLCAVCKRAETKVLLGRVTGLCVDHDHNTGVVRGLLCSRCNIAVGMLDEDVERAKQLARYMRRHKKEKNGK
jgi:hypothetical protein